jgi:hypothetical protein
MALDFPTFPNLNDTYLYGNTIWVWNGSAWAIQSTAIGSQGVQGATGATGVQGSTGFAPIATTGSTGVASFDDNYFKLGPTGHVSIKTGINSGNIIVLGTSTVFGAGATGALPALDGSLLLEVNAKFLQGKTPNQLTDGGTF